MTEDDQSESHRIRMQEATTDILAAISGLDTANEALQSLTAAITYILCNGISSEDEAYAACTRINVIIKATMKSAGERGETMWNMGSYH